MLWHEARGRWGPSKDAHACFIDYPSQMQLDAGSQRCRKCQVFYPSHRVALTRTCMGNLPAVPISCYTSHTYRGVVPKKNLGEPCLPR